MCVFVINLFLRLRTVRALQHCWYCQAQKSNEFLNKTVWKRLPTALKDNMCWFQNNLTIKFEFGLYARLESRPNFILLSVCLSKKNTKTSKDNQDILPSMYDAVATIAKAASKKQCGTIDIFEKLRIE